MFGKHKRLSKETGLAIRNSFASVSMDTSLFEFGTGFVPTREFILDSYVLGYTVSLLNMFRVFMHRGKDWPQHKTGEYMIHAFHEIQNGTELATIEEINQRILGLQQDEDFALGLEHGEINFGAIFGILKKDASNPVVAEAMSLSESYQQLSEAMPIGGPNDPHSGFKLAIAELTLKKALTSRFPE